MKNRGIYIASKAKPEHAERWRKVAKFYPVNSTWIYEAGQGESLDIADLWRRCVNEAASASAVVVYREEGEVLRGAWVEMGAALAHGVPVFAVGLEDQGTIARDPRIQHHRTFKEAFTAAIAVHAAAPPPPANIGADSPSAREKALREALRVAEAALADIGDADREEGDDLAWCEARAAQALPTVRAALLATPAEGGSDG